MQFSSREYLVIDTGAKSLFEIICEYHCGPFKEIIISDNTLSVGFEENFYMYDLAANTDILNIKLNGYFGHLYLHDDNFYVADAGGLFCIIKSGTTLWNNKNLAMDGVIIHDFFENKL